MRLPPLNALRAFEAAARHEGYIPASDELNVTRGAVSRHIKNLEEHIGVPLFVRQAQGVRLTNAGRQLQPVIAEALNSIASEIERMKTDANDLRIICPPANSIRWLLPRLEDFRRKHPEIRVLLTTDFHGDTGYESTDFDVGFSVEKWPNRPDSTEMLPLFPVRLTPACSPKLLRAEQPLNDVSELARFELLHETPKHQDWAKWIDVCCPGKLDARSGLNFPNLDMATRAAVLGAGVVMADLVLCREELESGALVAPFPELVCDGPFGAVSLLGSHDRWHEPKIEAFRTWASETAAQEARQAQSS
ncbi:Glycine cleavage system transcriptional activator [Sulfitobacter sp. THAF37]|uniref:LysR substrate-binding domain-containing protein n=1 Tax=Sulfitobacter sp. THAF37 TaxID=2587855 RepID=UPI001267EEC0|nr:LysR substrate-binding domain-containing protein [Sulfitobacter sp. THAF37]QFT59664.1 Glycine cleavage system transcriptional activator [Sulfitobacter sp. THAF37]